MQVSVHQIRYFEDKGVLLPSYTDTNQYRKYGIDQIYQLAQIMLLRKLGMPVQSIKESMAEAEPERIKEKLDDALAEAGRELARLQQLQQLIRKILLEQQNFEAEEMSCSVKQRDALLLRKWLEVDAASGLNARMLAEQPERQSGLFEADIHCIHEEGIVTLYTAVEEGGRSDRILPQGTYLSYSVQIEDESA